MDKKDKKPCCEKNKCKAKPKPKQESGKGDSPRNNQSDEFRDNYGDINWDQYHYDRFIKTK